MSCHTFQVGFILEDILINMSSLTVMPDRCMCGRNLVRDVGGNVRYILSIDSRQRTKVHFLNNTLMIAAVTIIVFHLSTVLTWKFQHNVRKIKYRHFPSAAKPTCTSSAQTVLRLAHRSRSGSSPTARPHFTLISPSWLSPVHLPVPTSNDGSVPLITEGFGTNTLI